MSVVVTTGKFCWPVGTIGIATPRVAVAERANTRARIGCCLQVTVGGRGGYGVRAIFGAGARCAGRSYPTGCCGRTGPDVPATPFSAPGQRVAGHHGPEHMAKLGLRRELDGTRVPRR